MKKIILPLLLLLTITAYGQQRLRVSILGDSYSTYQYYIPEGNEPWYFDPVRTDLTDVSDVRQGYNDDDYSPRSFITRLPRLGSPDIILIFGNTNDSWCGAKLGEYQYGDWKRADLYTYRPALAKLLNDAQSRYPNVRIFFIQNTELKPSFVESTQVICKHYGVPIIQLKDIKKQSGHPNIEGMKAISQQVLEHLRKALR